MPSTPWGGQPRFVLGPISGPCVRSDRTHGYKPDPLPTSRRRLVSAGNLILTHLKKKNKKTKTKMLHGRTSSGNLAFVWGHTNINQRCSLPVLCLSGPT